jgi:hypothetical protein
MGLASVYVAGRIKYGGERFIHWIPFFILTTRFELRGYAL